MHALLVLEDGRAFRGEAFGATSAAGGGVTRVGEIVFNTSMTGYQEVVTDPSYFGQMVAMTYPLIGNYGVNDLDNESAGPQIRGFVIEELAEAPSSWRSQLSLPEYFEKHGVLGIQGIDTRALTKHLRERGAMKACLTTEDFSVEEARRIAEEGSGVVGQDFVKEVSTPAIYEWDPEATLSRRWAVPNPSRPDADNADGEPATLPPVRHRIAVYDFGLKTNQLRRLRQHGFQPVVVPATTTASEVLALDGLDGVFLSNGPGDPGALDYIHRNVRELIGKKPIFGICLGHQVLGSALGGSTFKLKFGHRGGNQPVKDLTTGRVDITSQNHGFAVDPASLPPEVEVTHVNLNDNTVEGLRHRELPVFSVQYHPEAAPGPHDAVHFFQRFAELIEQGR